MKTKPITAKIATAVIGLSLAASAVAGLTDLSTSPLVTSSSSSVLPNIFLMMDDSGSMNWDYMPDVGNNPVFGTSKYGYASNQCNGVFYNPAIKYLPPITYDGVTSYSNASFTGAWMDGYKTSLGTLNLSTGFTLGLYQSYSAPGGGVPAYYYNYLGTQTADSQKNYYKSTTTFYKECNTTAADNPTATLTVSGSGSTSVTSITVNGVSIMSGASTANTSTSTVAANIAAKITAAGYSATASGSTVTITGPASAAAILPVVTQTGGMSIAPSAFTPFAKVVVSATSGPGGTDERQNFANWFSYYRTRINMMKSGTGFAFRSLDNHYRVGFATMNNNGGSKFLNLATFDATQKQNWYTMLYSTSVNNSTPLLKALSNVGRMYGNKLTTLNGVAVSDPMQYSCQQNFTILSTDGFWNDATNYDLNGNKVNNQDGDQPRPYNDGATSTVTEATPTSSTVRNQTDTPKTVTIKWSRDSITTDATKGGGTCTNKKYRVTTQNQFYNQVKNQNTSSVDDTVTTTVHTVVTTNGVVTSDTNSAPSNTVNNVSSNTTTSSDTGAPTGGTTWTNGTVSTYCTKSPGMPSEPSPGNNTITAASAGAPSTATGSATVTFISSSGPTVGATTTNTATSSGTSNTLADVAMYYYRTDIRNSGFGNCTGALGTDVCQDNVPKTNSDTASWQHMTTFTMGLGAFGRMDYSPTYATDSTGDYVAVKNGTLADPANGICSWGTNGQACNWPTPNVSGTPENIDDLWHAAVNGRGAYYSATNPTTLAAGLQNALSGIAARTGAAAAATTSNPNVSTGDNFLFSSTFNTAIWDGNIIRQQIDLTTGNLSATPDWSAQAKFDAGQTRTLYTYSASDTGNIKVFNWGNLTAAEKNYFALGNLGGLTQFCSSGPNCLSATDQATAAGANLVSFVMGDRTNEGALTDITKFYRLRSTAANPHPNTVLGDIVNAEAAYVKGSQSSYADTGYDTFKTTNSTRAGRVYVAANDGMLHAFDSETGTESWAYLPSFVLPNLPKLADKDYANRHQYFVDGTPSSGDVYYDGAWHTILVGGLNGGGRGYYALDVTDPTVAPTVLWEFSDANLGYTYGNPIFTKLSDGTWVVVVASGYNNVTPGDGKGYLYVLNAKTGAVIRTISTGVGNTTTPSGLAKIVGYASHPNIDNSVLRVYGGDLLGNLWRFDINAGTTQLIVTLKDSSANVQPITTTPALGDFNGLNMVYVATGKYIGVSDLSDTSQQTIYGIKDTLGTAGGALYASSRVGLTQQTVTTTTCPAGAPTSVCSSGETVRTTSSNTVNLVSGQGWYVDLPDSGERVNTDMTLTLGTLFLTSNVPNASACNSGGYSFGWQLDYRTGSAVQNTNYVSAVKIDNTLATRPIPVGLPNGAVIVYTRKSDGTTDTATGHFSLSNTIRRVNWRELTDQ